MNKKNEIHQSMAIINFFINDWHDFAQHHEGKVKICKTKFSPLGFGMSVWKQVWLYIPYQGSGITFLTGEATRMRIFFDFKKDLNQSFLIYPKDYTDSLREFFGIGNNCIKTNPVFDKKIITKSPNEKLIEKLLTAPVCDFLLKDRKRLANFKLEKSTTSSLLELNAPFRESNIAHMEEVLIFMKNSINNILEFHEKDQGRKS